MKFYKWTLVYWGVPIICMGIKNFMLSKGSGLGIFEVELKAQVFKKSSIDVIIC